MDKKYLINRRDFLSKSIRMAAGAVVLKQVDIRPILTFAQSDQKIGRICAGGEGAWFDLKAKPDLNSQTVGSVTRDDIIPWYHTTAANRVDLNSINQRWVETEGGFVYAGYVQPVKNIPNVPLMELPSYGDKPGMWVEITVPAVDIIKKGPPGTYWLQHALKPRLYYGQVFWASEIRTDESSKVQYLLTQRFGAAEEYYWTPAEACKPITPEDVTPITPEIENKRVVVNLARQTLSCFEGDREIHFCRVSTGPLLSKGWQTPPGDHPIWRKLFSLHMSAGGGTGEAFDTPAIAWTSLFTTTGAAIHTSYWHNEYGFARSHGCVNCLPEDAKFVWRWTSPVVPYEPGDLTWNDWQKGSSRIVVVES
jgi:hypothetical protein